MTSAAHTRRDRHGRGLRRPLHPLGSPGMRSRGELFDDAVADAAERLGERWGRRWGKVEFSTEDVPPSDPAPWEEGVALGRLFPADLGQPTRIVLYRRPIEQRCDPHELRALVRDVLAEHVGHLLGRSPEDVDPDYGSGI
jgi:predicted Zn-dependent protease with MMP-like domain